ncbi:peptidoglycan synthase [Rouxiella sp. S1S-2]|uniref:penicillin-binding transpeptidase domain-containing protein n=1 Tax=Rouxiella sp. S1S-2 TaxID=2653856 RepID=UPI001265959E|nr:penicillin-binding transpeptidase domain-containing protein [Rouxiella sp. S1S-2]KAB7895939.1 peptidoglycan synthase [Rouxiella sp. S1S-2]
MPNPKKNSAQPNFYSKRFALICLGIVCCMGLLLGRVGYLQLLNRPMLERQADQRSLRTQIIPAGRGTIADRNGHPLALSVASKDVIADPYRIAQLHSDLNSPKWQYLASALDMPLSQLQQIITVDPKRRFVFLGRKIEQGIAKDIGELHLGGIILQHDDSRYYPMSEAAANLVGVVGTDNEGLTGLERGFNTLLQGKPGMREFRQDGQGNVIGILKDVPPEQPPTVNLSIDSYIQYVVYAALRKGVMLNQADSGAAVMVDVNTGEILGMASYPSFNPNNYAGVDAKDMRNVAVSDSFEPGSTVKPLVVMSGLAHNIIRPDTVLDTRPYTVNGHLIRDVGHESALTITGVLQKSSDIGVSHIALAMPAQVLVDQYHSFGLGKPTDLGIGGESGGYFPLHRERWADIERATFAFGYGLRVTPLQIAREYATIGSFGIYRPLSITKVTPPVLGTRVMDKNVVETVVHMMESDALPGGSGLSAAVPGYRLAIKTGTAEKMGPSGKYDGGYINYTAGVAPASNPRVALVVMVNNPQAGKHFGGSVAGPIFGEIMGQVLNHMNIAPDALVPETPPTTVVSTNKAVKLKEKGAQ